MARVGEIYRENGHHHVGTMSKYIRESNHDVCTFYRLPLCCETFMPRTPSP